MWKPADGKSELKICVPFPESVGSPKYSYDMGNINERPRTRRSFLRFRYFGQSNK